tara:strand:+ start:218466 stop:218822 length:357 start_codon:yes stop_codon:yes gene_type:complete
MKAKFKEHYLYEPPTENYYRGISVTMNGARLLSMEYDEDTHPVTKEEEDDDEFWIKENRKTLTIQLGDLIPYHIYCKRGERIELCKHYRFLLSDKNKAIEEANNIIKRFRNFLKNGNI